MQRIRKGDEVVVTTGRDKGKRGTVLRRVSAEFVVVEDLHAQPGQPLAGQQGVAPDQVEGAHAGAGPRTRVADVHGAGATQIDRAHGVDGDLLEQGAGAGVGQHHQRAGPQADVLDVGARRARRQLLDEAQRALAALSQRRRLRRSRPVVSSA